jgi:hypothetical protein
MRETALERRLKFVFVTVENPLTELSLTDIAGDYRRSLAMLRLQGKHLIGNVLLGGPKLGLKTQNIGDE